MNWVQRSVGSMPTLPPFGLLSTIDSKVLSLDEVYFRARLQVSAGRKKLFHHGWGDNSLVDAVRDMWSMPGEPDAADIKWSGDWRQHSGVLLREGSFTGQPYERWVPEEAKRAGVLLVKTDRCDGRAAVLLAPTSREIGFGRRMRTAVKLAKMGVCVVMLDNPWMGNRKPAAQFETVVSTFAEYPLMSACCVEENRMVMAWLRHEGFERLCVSGVSQGGFTGAAAGLRLGFSVGVVAVATPHSAEAVVMGGIPGRICDWDALERTAPKGRSAQECMHEIFELTRLDALPIPVQAPRIHLFAARGDRYVRPESYEVLEKRWKDIAQVDWAPGGHVSTILESHRYSKAIQEWLASGRSVGAWA